jgi:hypothetical protein
MLELKDVRDSFLPVVGLVRKSSGKDSKDQRDSIPAQVNKITQFCEDYKLEIEKEYISGKWKDDEGTEKSAPGFSVREGSGLDIERSDIDDILKASKAGGTKTIVIDDFSRLMRADLRNAARKLDFFCECEINLIIVEEGPRLFEPEKSSHFQELVDMAKESHRYSSRTSRNTIRGISHRAEEMLTPIQQGYGYNVISEKDHKRVIDWRVEGNPEELAIIKEAIHRYIKGDKKLDICVWLNKKTGWKVEQKKMERIVTDIKWSGAYQKFKVKAGKIHTVGRNGTAVEYQRFFSAHDRTKTYKSIISPQDPSVTITIPLKQQLERKIDRGMDTIAIISEDEHFQVMERYNKRDRRNRVEQIKHSFGGLVYCADCGHKMTSQKRNQNKEIQYCCGEYMTSREICTNRKAIKEKLLSYIVMVDYLGNLFLNTKTIIEGLDEKRKLVSATPEYLKLKRKEEGWLNYKKRLIDENRIDGIDFKLAEVELSIIKRDLEMESTKKGKVIVGGDDKWTMGNLLNYDEPDLEEVIEESGKLLDEYREKPFIPSIDLVRSIVEKVVVSFESAPMKRGKEGRVKSMPNGIEVHYTTGFSNLVDLKDEFSFTMPKKFPQP